MYDTLLQNKPREKKEKNGFSAKIGQQKRVAEVLRALVFFPVQLAG